MDKNLVIWRNKELEVLLVSKEKTFFREGSHFVVFHRKIKKAFWEIERPVSILESGDLALAVAWMITRSGCINDIWPNIQFNDHSFFNKGINIFGRNPLSPLWGRPITFSKSLSTPNFPRESLIGIKKSSRQFIKFWEESFSSLPIFSNGIEHFSTQGPEYHSLEKIFFYERSPKKRKNILWANKRFILVYPNNPHLNGYHIQVFPRLKYWDKVGGFKSPWQLSRGLNNHRDQLQVRGYLEILAILHGVLRILTKSQDISFYHPEIHFSGNWNKDLLSKKQGGKIDIEKLKKIQKSSFSRRKELLQEEKRKYLQEGKNAIEATGHAHLYATFSPREFVNLPSRPFEEKPGEWEGISALDGENLEKLKGIIQKDLTPWLKKHCVGLEIKI